MPDIRGQLLPVYVLADESGSMSSCIGELNAGLASLHASLLGEPMVAAKVRFTVLGFSDSVVPRIQLADLRNENELPSLVSRSTTNYGAAFNDLGQRIPQDIHYLKGQSYQVHRPAVFFLSDGQPSDGRNWLEPYRRLTDRSVVPASPNIIACGIGRADPKTILEVATSPNFAFVSIEGASVGRSIAQFCGALTKSVVASARSVNSAQPELVVERPEGFRMAIDYV